MTVVTNLLPDKKYEKYFRLFAGMVLILLVLKPFTGGLGWMTNWPITSKPSAFRKRRRSFRPDLRYGKRSFKEYGEPVRGGGGA